MGPARGDGRGDGPREPVAKSSRPSSPVDGGSISNNNHDSYSTLSYSGGTNSYEQPSVSDYSGTAQSLERRHVEAEEKDVKRRKLATTSSREFEKIVNELIAKSNRIKNSLDAASLWSN